MWIATSWFIVFSLINISFDMIFSFDALWWNYWWHERWIYQRKASGEGKGALYSYRQHVDEHERWLSVLLRPDIHRALHHVPVVKEWEIQTTLSTLIQCKIFLLTHYLYIFYLQRPDARTLHKERLEALVSNECHSIRKRVGEKVMEN